MDIIKAIHDERFFRPLFGDLSSWFAWEVYLRALFGLPFRMVRDGPLLKACTGYETLPKGRFKESWVICGRRSGKSWISAVIAVYLAAFKDWSKSLRVGEILGLRWSDIDFEEGLITIRKERAKSKRRETVPINSLVEAALRDIKREDDFVFYNPKTKTYVKSVSKAFTGACRRAGLKGLTLHDLRHTAATWMLRLGVPIVTVSKILRHSDIRITMRYLHSTADMEKQGVEVLASVFKPKQDNISKIWLVDDKREAITN